MAASAADIVKAIPSQLLESTVRDEHIGQLAFEMIDWEICAPILGLKQPDVDSIKADHKSLELQAQKSLFRWREIQGFKATNHRFIVSLCSARRADLAKKLQSLLLHLPDDSASKQDVLENFRLYLQECYASCDHPSCTQWPFSVLQSYVDLSLFDIPTTNKSPLNPGSKEESTRKSIELDNLFLAGNCQKKRKVLLLEGVAGSGKTTLSWHSCRKWAAGELFKHIQLLIHLSLNDPDVASATCLADIIPHSSKKMREAVAEAIEEKDGEGVCFFFDACDEAPKKLWKKFLYQFIESKSRSTLRKCSIVLAARPEIDLKSLSQLLTARVRIEGFESSKLEAYLDSSLSSDLALRGQVAETLKINPELVGLCSLPINAAILVHLYHSLKDNLPSTTTGLFKPLVLNLLLRYIQRTKKEYPLINEFTALPKDTLPKFNSVCRLAFEAFMAQTRTFSKDILKEHGLSKSEEAMGFLQHHQQLTAFGSNYRCSFLHLSLQEFLAAVHITTMKDCKQVTTIQQILQKNPLSPVLPFYAGLTKLSNGGAFDMLLKVTDSPLDTKSVFQNITTFANDKRRLFLALINCIYETQLPALVDGICPPLPPPYDQSQISLFGLPLNSLDCLSIGFFLGNTSDKWMDLLWCSISDTGLEVLVKQMKANHSVRKATATNCVNMSFNAFSKHTVPLLKDMLLTLKGIGICCCWNAPKELLATTIEGVHSNSNLQIVNLASCNLDHSHVNYLILLLATARNMQELYLDGNGIGLVMDLVSEALKLSTIRRLSLENCQIYSADLQYLADAVSQNRYLTILFINSNLFRPNALTCFLKKLLNNNASLEFIKIDTLNTEQNSLIQQINWNRKQQGRQILFPMFHEMNPRDMLRNSILTDVFSAYSKNPQLQRREERY